MKSPLRLVCSAFCLIATSAGMAQVCPQPPALERNGAKNIFTDQQEIDLGDAIADSMASDITVIDDPSLGTHLDELGARIARFLPPNNLRFRFFLIDLSEVNAFSLPGGRIYVARKLVALTRSDDELAGVLAHEMGHIVTHQQAIQTTRLLRLVLGVTELGGRADIYDKFQRLLENERRKPIHIRDEEEADQFVADKVALFAMARAGFAPQAFIDWWDRFSEIHGKTGSWFSDLFGQTKPEQKRLRELLRSISAMPAECVQIAPSSSSEFAAWQSRVIAASASTHLESLPGLLVRQKLTSPLRPDVNNLRFSPDGQYVLAQDEGGIHVLTRDPFEFLFFIDAPDADKAFFSPDSKSIIFNTPAFRVEIWDVASRKRTSVHEILLRLGCLESALSPDGKYLACLNEDFALQLVEVESGTELDSRKDFFQSPLNSFLFLLEFRMNLDLGLVQLEFSPDGRYFLAGTHTKIFAYDLTARHEASLPSTIKNLMHGQFKFVDSERILGVNAFNPARSSLVHFPSGEKLQELTLAYGLNVERTPQGKYIAVGPLKTGKRGFMDLATGKLNGIVREDAGDIYANTVAYEEIDGRILLIEVPSAKVVAQLQLTQSHLGDSGAITVSPDFHWLAASTGSRGAVWDIQHNARRPLIRPFNDGWFSDDDTFYADFPKHENQDRGVLELRPAGDQAVVLSIGEMSAIQFGPYLVVRAPAKESGNRRKNWTYSLRDFRTNQTMWTRHFPQEPPAIALTPDYHSVVMGWPAWTESAKEELKQFPDLKNAAEKEDMFFEVMDLKNSSVTGKLLVKTNKLSFQVRTVRVDGDWMTVQVSGDRVLTYSLSLGKEIGHVFGVAPALSSSAGAYAVSSGEGEVNVYGLADSQLRRTYKFPASIAYKKFSADGKKLFVLTRDQTAYVVDLNAVEEQPSGVVKATAQ